MDVLWQVGDRWRDLTEDLHQESQTTLLTYNGTVILFDAGKQLRISSGHVMDGDERWRSLDTIGGTPCGIFTTMIDGSAHCTTRLRLMVRGLERDLANTDDGRAALSADWAAPGHDPTRCRWTPYCQWVQPAGTSP